MIRTLLACAMFVASGVAFAGLDSVNPDVLHLHKRTVRSVSVVAILEGQSSASTAAYASTMKQWVEEGLLQNGFVIDPKAKNAPELRFGGYCGQAVGGCTLKFYVARDLWYDLPDGAVHRLPARDVVEDKLAKETATFSQEEMYPLFVGMMTKFVQAAAQINPMRASDASFESLAN